MAEASIEIRRAIVLLAPRKDARIVPMSAEMPCRWFPTEVENPNTPGYPFSEPGAWRFIAELANTMHPIEEILLKKPPNTKAYVMIYTVSNSDSIYIKVQLRGNKIYGRSFHYSTK